MRKRPEEAPWTSRIGGGGWALVEQHGAQGRERILVRVATDNRGRYRIRDLHVLDTGEPMTAERLRAVRVSAIEAILNLPEQSAAVADRMDTRPPFELEQVLDEFVTSGAVTTGRAHERDHARGFTPIGGTAPRQHSGHLRPFARTGRRGYDDDFYRQVADLHRAVVARGGRPGPVAMIAEVADVPRTTAARWVKEARRRELLDPAPAQGKAA